MSAPIKRYKYGYKDDGNGNRFLALIDDTDGTVVLHTDHLASHAFDEAVERALCNVSMIEQNEQLKINGFLPLTLRQEYAFTAGWIRCAKSRAKRAGGDV